MFSSILNKEFGSSSICQCLLPFYQGRLVSSAKPHELDFQVSLLSQGGGIKANLTQLELVLGLSLATSWSELCQAQNQLG
jgi:hypothetical protein